MDELLGRRMPHSAEAEQAVLGSMLIDPMCISEVVDKLHANDFYMETNREIYETMFNMFSFSQAIDPVTVLDTMRVRGVFREDSQKYVLELMQITPTAANVLKYAAIVRDKSLMRALAEIGSEITEMVYEGAGEANVMLEAAEKKVYALRKGRTVGGLTPIAAILPKVYEEISTAAMSDSNIPGLSSGLNDLDTVIMGLNKGDLILIAARPAMGKTSIALNIAMYVGKFSGKTVAVFSLEMSKEQLVSRFLSGESLVDGKKLHTGDLSPEEWKRVATGASTLSETDIQVDDNPSLSVAEMNAQCRRLSNLGLVVIDYLQLMQSSGSGKSYSSESRTQVVSDISRMLKIMAKELNVPVICLSQLSRASESRADKRPMLSDLRESGAIEQDADIVIGLYRDGYYNKDAENPNLAEAILLKNRRGEAKSVPLMWLPEYTTYANAEFRHDDDF